VPKVLILDDEPVFLASLSLLLKQEGFEVETASGARGAIELAARFAPDVLIADWVLRDELDGIEVAERLSRAHPHLRLIFITGYDSAELQSRIEAFEGARSLKKPFSPEQLLAAVRACTG